MKKMIAMLLAVLLLAGLSVTSFAEASPEQQGAGTKVPAQEGFVKLTQTKAQIPSGTQVTATTEDDEAILVYVDEIAETEDLTEDMQADLDALEEGKAAAEKALTLTNVNSALKSAGIIKKADGKSGTDTGALCAVAEGYPAKIKLPVERPDDFLTVLVRYSARWLVPDDMTLVVEDDVTYVVFTITGPAYITLVYAGPADAAP